MNKNIIIILIFLWSVFAGYFYLKGESTIWSPTGNLLIDGLHYYLPLIFILIFIVDYINNNIILRKETLLAIILLLIIILLSYLVNGSDVFSAFKFTITILIPFIYYLYIVYQKNINRKQIIKYLNFYFIVCILQYFIALFSYNNISKLLHSQFIIDDLFRGTMGAYQFVFLLNLYTIFIINKFIVFKRISIIEMISGLLFFLSFIISGAGGYLFIFTFSSIIFIIYNYLIKNYKLTVRNIIISVSLLGIIIYSFLYFYSNYSLAYNIIMTFQKLDFSNSPKIINSMMALESLKTYNNYFLGFGPGQYLSGIGKNPDASYFGSFLLEKMGSSFYGVNSDIMIIITELGFLGLLGVYILLRKILKDVKNYNNNLDNKGILYKSTFNHVIVFSVLLSLQYRILFFFVSSYTLMFFLGIIKRLEIEELKITNES